MRGMETKFLLGVIIIVIVIVIMLMIATYVFGINVKSLIPMSGF